MAARDFFRDRHCSVTPNGRPATRARKAAAILTNNQHPSSFYLFARKPKSSQIISLEECRDARPPLAMEQIQTPSPCTYNYLTSFLCGNRRVPAGPLSSRSSCVPHCSSFASETSTESKKTLKLVRTNLWLHETASHGQRPDACTYTLPNIIGSSSLSSRTSPSFTMRARTASKIKINLDSPSPNTYDIAAANRSVFRTLPSFSIPPTHRGKRRPVSTPGPAHYCPKTDYIFKSNPAFSFYSCTSAQS